LKYEEFLSQVKTGDIFLFEGTGGYSWAIQCATGMRYSHVGVVVKLVDPKDPTRTHFMIWESTGPDGSYDFITQRDKNGLRLVSMHEKLYEYARRNFSISYRPITIWDEKARRRIGEGEAGMKAWTLFLQGSHIPYETNYVELANAHKRWVVGSSGDVMKDQQSLKSVFCSEAVMWFFRDAIGLSMEDEEEGITWLPRDFTPADFARETEGIPFAYSDPPGASFGGQYVVASRELIGKGLAKRYREHMRDQRRIGRAFQTMLKASVKRTDTRDGGGRTVHINGKKLWRVDFGENAYPLTDAETGTASVSLDRFQ
jgi:hypothetical protein